MDIYKLDRTEEDFAVMESPKGDMLRFDINSLPKGAKDGDCFSLIDGAFIKEESETKARKNSLFGKLSALITKKSVK